VKSWFLGLEPRERLLVTVAAALLAIAVVWLAALRPLFGGVGDLRTSVADKQALLADLRAAETLVRELGAGAGPRAARSNQPMVVIVDRTTRAAGLAPGLRRTQPAGDDSIRVNFEDVAFDGLMRWLEELRTGHGIHVASASVDALGAPGLVNASLVLERS
jgi:general secretion pathway protein M